MKKILTTCFTIVLLGSCSRDSQTGSKDPAKEDDPRMAGFKGKIAKTFEESKEDWPERTKAPAGAPNVLIILLDDVGFSQLGCFGGVIETPNLDKLAANGLRYTNFHTTALCSPSRAALMSGRNHHSVGLGSHALVAMGFPGYNGMIPPQAASGAKMLQEHGYTNYAIGKWDHTPLWEVQSSGPFNGWASEEGYDHYYGFMSADIHNFQPIMYEDHWPTMPAKGNPDYHINKDMADRAEYWLTSHVSISPNRPFMMFWGSATMHAPHHASKEYLDKYKGKFDAGWDAMREEILKNQIEKGIVAKGTKLSPRINEIPEWNSLSAEKKKLYARQMEAAAGSLTQADHEIGRIIGTLERTGQLENTIVFVTADNGCSGEGGLEGSHNEMLVLNGISKTSFEENNKKINDWGSAETDNHYHAGWAMAGNTPFKYFKQIVHNGGISDALIVHWPKGIKGKGEIRTQYSHIIDIVPTIMDVTGVGFQEEVDGVKQMPFDGVSLKYSFNDAKAPTNHPVQYYEQIGNRAIYSDGWKAVTIHGNRMPWTVSGTFDFDKDVWELYNINEDPTETNDLAASNPKKLEELKKKFEEEAWKYNVYPMYDNADVRLRNVTKRIFPADKKTFTYFPPGAEYIAEAASPPVKARTHSITAWLESDGRTEGVIAACGGYFAGYSLFVKNNIVSYGYNYFDEKYFLVKASKPLTAGRHEVKMVYESQSDHTGKVVLFIDNEKVGEGVISNVVMGKYSLSEPFDVGIDNGGSVIRKEYTSPFKFSDKLTKVVFTLM